MQEQKDFQEIEELGEEAEDYEYGSEEASKRGTIPLIQLFLCVLVLLALLILKFTDIGKYGEVTHWYETNMSREIELPKFQNVEGGGEAASPSSSEEGSQIHSEGRIQSL